jgi:hypothetical protein
VKENVMNMNAHTGDEIVIKAHHVGDRDRVALVLDVRGNDGSPPYVIEWADVPGQHLFWPGQDAQIREHDGTDHARPARDDGGEDHDR